VALLGLGLLFIILFIILVIIICVTAKVSDKIMKLVVSRAGKWLRKKPVFVGLKNFKNLRSILGFFLIFVICIQITVNFKS